MERKEKEQNTRKMSLWKRFFAVVKKIFFKCFGKARWFLMALTLNALCVVIVVFNFGIHLWAEGVAEDDRVLKETSIRDALDFSVNDNGLAAVILDIGTYRTAAYFHMVQPQLQPNVLRASNK